MRDKHREDLVVRESAKQDISQRQVMADLGVGALAALEKFDPVRVALSALVEDEV
jgi:hypothetical protein